MAGAFVQATTHNEVGTALTKAITYTAGNTLVIGISHASGSKTITISDGVNAFNEVGSVVTDGSLCSTYLFVATGLIGTGSTLTINSSGSIQASVNINEFSGIDTTTPTGGTADGSNYTSGDIASTSLSVAGADGDVVVAVGGEYYATTTWAAGATNPSGFAAEATATKQMADAQGNIGMGYAVLSGSYGGAVSLDPSSTTYGQIKAVVLKAAAGGGGGSTTDGLIIISGI